MTEPHIATPQAVAVAEQAVTAEHGDNDRRATLDLELRFGIGGLVDERVPRLPDPRRRPRALRRLVRPPPRRTPVTLRQRLADLLRSPELARAIAERDSSRRFAATLSRCVGADIPIEDHQRALELIGAMLARFRDEPGVVRDDARQRIQSARVGRTVVDHWRAEHQRLRSQLAADRRDLDASEQRRAEVSRG